MNQKRLTTAWYSLTVLLSSGVLMVLEITAGRLIAPYVGVSLYTWTSIIGVILAGLSLGNWLGGYWVDRGGNEKSVGLVLGWSAFSSAAVLYLLTWVAPMIQTYGLDLLSASFLFVLSLFFLPAVLLGIVTPILTTLALRLDDRLGHIVGRMHALAALGSIVGTFITGYWLVQFFGTRTVILLSAALLFLLALPFLIRGRQVLATVSLVCLGVGLLFVTQLRGGFLNPCDSESQYYCIRTVDVSEEVPYGRARAMILDHLLHSINHETQPTLLASPYVHLMSQIIKSHYSSRQQPSRFYFAGGGAYTQPRAVLAEYPNAHITVAELDPQVTRSAQAQLWVSVNKMKIFHQDARIALLRQLNQRFDVVVGDVFHDIAVPYHLTTSEYSQLIKSRLATDGLYVLNIVDKSTDPLLVKSITKTLQEHFQHVRIWLDESSQGMDRTTFVISASDVHRLPPSISSQDEFNRHWRDHTTAILNEGTLLGDVPVLTDNFVPVERLVAGLLLGRSGN